jgi:hypothetical protein
MDMQLLEKKFRLMGARVKVGLPVPDWRTRWRTDIRFTVDVRSDRKGEYFEIGLLDHEHVELNVLDIQPEMRHLLLMAPVGKFLCGHDERHWFAAAIPGNASNVKTALVALKPAVIRLEEARKHIRTKDRFRRRNDAFIRQGEWFFVPAPELKPMRLLIMRNEPLSRGAGSKPHMCEYIYRTGGETVHVCRERPNGITEAQYRKLIATNPGAKGWGWRVMKRDMEVYARGRVWHSDHKSIYLDSWHRVLMNTENQAPAMRNLVFLD